MRGVGLAALMMLLTMAAWVGAKAEEESESFFNRKVYPEGYEMCQSGTLKRCEDGAWADIGMCEREPMPPAFAGGGDDEGEGDWDDRSERRH